MTDAFGNTIKVKAPKKKLSRKESKARDKARAAKRDRGEEVTPTSEEVIVDTSASLMEKKPEAPVAAA